MTATRDWEAPAGGDEAPFARLRLPAYVYEGPGDAHWIGQRCGVVDTDMPGDMRLVVMACGCRTQAPRSALRRKPHEN